jgi:hypothetical protein
MRTARFWNNLHQVRSRAKVWDWKYFKHRWEQENQRAKAE